MENESQKLVIVTGYGQFCGHEVNASGEAVKRLPKEIKIGENVYRVKTLELAVEYEDVDKKVDEIWRNDPFLVVHCGVHGTADKIKLEKCSLNGFCLTDFKGKKLDDPILCLAKSGKCRGLSTELNVDKITNLLNANHRDGMFETSCDVGRYLCGYIYLKSLDVDPRRSLFVHVPCIDKPFSLPELSEGILKIVEQCLLDLESES